jgi:hypothetical protein
MEMIKFDGSVSSSRRKEKSFSLLSAILTTTRYVLVRWIAQFEASRSGLESPISDVCRNRIWYGKSAENERYVVATMPSS